MIVRRTQQDDEPGGLTVYGAAWCEDTTHVRRLLTQWGIKHNYVDIDDEPYARRKVMLWNLGCLRTPMVTIGALEFPRLSAPIDEELHEMVYENGLIKVGPLLL